MPDPETDTTWRDLLVHLLPLVSRQVAVSIEVEDAGVVASGAGLLTVEDIGDRVDDAILNLVLVDAFSCDAMRVVVTERTFQDVELIEWDRMLAIGLVGDSRVVLRPLE